MDDDGIITGSTPSGTDNFLRDYFMNSGKEIKAWPQFVGIDWAKDSGMNRGEVIDRHENVIHVRFKTVDVSTP